MGVCQRGVEDGSSREFNDWIAELKVEEASWVDQKFTWSRPNGAARSKLDRFLLSPEWLAKWPGSSQHTLDRNFSDHCPLLLRSKCVDWGPKPFRILDYWLTDNSFKKIVQDSWTSNQQFGWGEYVLKEKIKRLKSSIKTWNRDQFGDTFKNYKKIEEELNKLEVDTIERCLEPYELMTRKKLQEELWAAALSQESLLRQKARSRWIREGDCNFRYFHLLINSSCRNNCLNGVMIDGSWIEEPTAVKEAVRLFFLKHFQESDYDRPHLVGICFRNIGRQQNELLVEWFQEDEVKRAV